jgi:hypothetical protein
LKDVLSRLHYLHSQSAGLRRLQPSATLGLILLVLSLFVHLHLPNLARSGWRYSPVMSPEPFHLDTVPDQSTIAFLRCLKRFVARRGLPRRFISDNGKTFKAASKYLETVFKDGLVQEHLTGLGVTWQFNVERAPWWGGAFKGMVRSTKRCLKKSIGRAHFSLDELTTALAEIEAVLNSRPLSYVLRC